MTNEVLETIKKRRSVRVYKPDAVPQELLDAVLEAGTYAPTGRGQQSPVIIAVSAAEYRKKIAELNAAVMGKDGDPYYGAPTVILVLTDKDSATGVEDASCVLENMRLAAASLGLGNGVGAPRTRNFRKRSGQKITCRMGRERQSVGRGKHCDRLCRRPRKQSRSKKSRLYL